MAAGGVIASEAVRHPLEPLPQATRAGLFELVDALAPIARRWGK
jgi:4-hydroxy-tetrahydrodipicolinate synthase